MTVRKFFSLSGREFIPGSMAPCSAVEPVCLSGVEPPHSIFSHHYRILPVNSYQEHFNHMIHKE